MEGIAIPETVPTWIAILAVVLAALSLLLSLFAVLRSRSSARRAAGAANVPRVDRGEDAMRIDLLSSQLDAIATRMYSLPLFLFIVAMAVLVELTLSLRG